MNEINKNKGETMKQYLNESSWILNTDNPNYLYNCGNTPLLYKLYDLEGDLMYIGKTTTGARRISAHNRDKGWKTSNHSFIDVPLKQQNNIERYLIEHYKPYQNKTFNSLYQGGKKYLYQV